MLLQEGANPIQSLDAAVPPKNLIVLHFHIRDKKYSEIEKMRTRGMSAKTEMEPVEVFARIKTVSNTEVSKQIISPMRGPHYLWYDC